MRSYRGRQNASTFAAGLRSGCQKVLWFCIRELSFAPWSSGMPVIQGMSLRVVRGKESLQGVTKTLRPYPTLNLGLHKGLQRLAASTFQHF